LIEEDRQEEMKFVFDPSKADCKRSEDKLNLDSWTEFDYHSDYIDEKVEEISPIKAVAKLRLNR
jgi:hypothetical protein